MKQLIFSIVFCMAFYIAPAQTSSNIMSLPHPDPLTSYPSITTLLTSNLINNETVHKDNSNTLIIAPDFYAAHIGFFCKQELKIEHSIHTPLKFRLGTFEHNNYLEQKTGYFYPLQ
ncbi:MAG: hypothetical protein WCG87_12435 [Bacteroidota bacterium]